MGQGWSINSDSRMVEGPISVCLLPPLILTLHGLEKQTSTSQQTVTDSHLPKMTCFFNLLFFLRKWVAKVILRQFRLFCCCCWSLLLYYLTPSHYHSSSIDWWFCNINRPPLRNHTVIQSWREHKLGHLQVDAQQGLPWDGLGQEWANHGPGAICSTQGPPSWPIGNPQFPLSLWPINDC